ncbi:unnamed protein product [Nezara viridula]|uniref:Uncharacterized protein n=1 Tax=Nezara viridula TaxID=85310 RepID=A0A9P0HI36_NEZVI|nr:unnamed protein product [Nezara viridula]
MIRTSYLSWGTGSWGARGRHVAGDTISANERLRKLDSINTTLKRIERFERKVHTTTGEIWDQSLNVWKRRTAEGNKELFAKTVQSISYDKTARRLRYAGLLEGIHQEDNNEYKNS